MTLHRWTRIAAVGGVVALAPAAATWGTVLLFEQESGSFGNGGFLPQDYGDNVIAEIQNGYRYGVMHGFTPNVVVEYGTGPSPVDGSAVTWATGFGGLTDVIEAESEPRGLQLSLVADPGYHVQLHGFDMAGWPTADYTINAVRVRDGNDVVLFEVLNPVILGANSSHTDFDFAQPLSAPVIKVEWDSSNLGSGSDNIGMDNLAFSQALIPEPASLSVLLVLSAATLGRRR